MQTYQYKTLPSASGHIRLLVLQPAQCHLAPLQGVLVPIRLDTNVIPFEAVSYTWGKEAAKRHIRIRDDLGSNKPPSKDPGFDQQFEVVLPDTSFAFAKSLMITSNLDAALRQFRLTTKPRVLWADAICIQQDNLAEKAHQVGLMGTIYGTSQHTLAWLGDIDPRYSSKCFAYCKALAASRSDYGLASLDIRNGPPVYWDEAVHLHRRGLMANGLSQMLIWVLFWRPWFRRLWCVQEVVLPQHVLLCWGQHELSWEVFQAVVDLVCQVAEDINDDDNTRSSWMSQGFDTDSSSMKGLEPIDGAFMPCWKLPYLTVNTRARFHGLDEYMTDLQDRAGIENYASADPKHVLDRRETLLRLATLFGAFGCKDPRDRLFALLGISTPTPIQPDYTQSLEKVVSDASIQLFQAGDLHHLHYLRSLVDSSQPFQSSLSSYANFISWDRNLSLPLGGKEPPMFHAATDVKPSINVVLNQKPNLQKPGTVAITGYNIAHVTNVFPNKGLRARDYLQQPQGATMSIDPTNTAIWVGAVYRMLVKSIAPSTKYRSGITPAAAVGRTLSLNGAYPDTRLFERVPDFHNSFVESLSGWIMDRKFMQIISGELASEATEQLRKHALPDRPSLTQEEHVTIFAGFARQVLPKLAGVTAGRDAAFLHGGWMALIPHGCKEGDQVVLLDGGETPFVMRRTTTGWKILGDCYVEGLMEGEGLKMGLDRQSYTLE